jgi:hypothetical protein
MHQDFSFAFASAAARANLNLHPIQWLEASAGGAVPQILANLHNGLLSNIGDSARRNFMW